MPRPKKYQEVIRILKNHDSRFELWSDRGKGSEQMLYHPDINGRPEQIPLTCHKGKDVRPGLLSAVIRRFNLPKRIFG